MMDRVRGVNVLLVGDYPPPYGGVSVQVEALMRRVELEPGSSCTVLNIGASRKTDIPGCLSAPSLWAFIRTVWDHACKRSVIHLITNGHNGKSWLCALVCAAAGILYGRRTIVALDSGAMPAYVLNARVPMRFIIWAALRFSGKVICRNHRGREALLAVGRPPIDIAVMAAYIPAAPAAPEAIPVEVERFLRDHDPVIGTVIAFRPEYGLELLVAAVDQLAAEYSRIGLVIIGSGGEKDLQKGARVFCEKGRAICLSDLPHPICLAVMSRLDLFARCTYYDGDAISVREALALGLPVVASDTDYRPEGVTLFTKGDVKNLVKKLRYTLEQSGELSVKASRGAIPNTADRVLKLYHELAEQPGKGQLED